MLIKIYCDMVDEGGGWIVRSIKQSRIYFLIQGFMGNDINNYYYI